jgi:cell division GTPase FtsZ
MTNEDALCKSNSLKTLSKLSEMVKNNVLSNLIVVDNARIEAIYAGVGQMEFFSKANKAITEPLDVFNSLSAKDSATKGLDPMELHKLLLDGGGLTSYGAFTVEDYEDDVAIATAVIENLNNNLLASGLKLEEAKYVGFIVAANERVWKNVSATSIQYAKSMVSDLASNTVGIFDGSYVIDCEEDVVKVYSLFSGMGLPRERVEELKNEVKVLESKAQKRDENRNLTLDVGMGTETLSQADSLRKKIKAKNSTFGKIVGNKSSTIRDRRS